VDALRAGDREVDANVGELAVELLELVLVVSREVLCTVVEALFGRLQQLRGSRLGRATFEFIELRFGLAELAARPSPASARCSPITAGATALAAESWRATSAWPARSCSSVDSP
jgi:hypothetical protein